MIQKWSRKCSILGHRNDPQTTPKMTPWEDPKIVDFWSDVATMYGTQDPDIGILYPYGLELVKNDPKFYKENSNETQNINSKNKNPKRPKSCQNTKVVESHQPNSVFSTFGWFSPFEIFTYWCF